MSNKQANISFRYDFFPKISGVCDNFFANKQKIFFKMMAQ